MQEAISLDVTAGDRAHARHRGGRRACGRICASTGAAAAVRRPRRTTRDAQRPPGRGPRRVSTVRCSRLRLLHSTLVPGVSIAETDPPACRRPRRAQHRQRWPHAGHRRRRPTPNSRSSSRSRSPARSGCPTTPKGIVALDSIIDGAGHRRDRRRRRRRTRRPGAAHASARRSAAARWCGRSISPPRRSSTACRARAHPDRLRALLLRAAAARARRGATAASPTSPIARRSRPRRRRRRSADAGAEAGPIRDLVRLRVKPEYTAEAYGQPAYLQLSLRGPARSRTGAGDGSEMGAYCHLKQPQRESEPAHAARGIPAVRARVRLDLRDVRRRGEGARR